MTFKQFENWCSDRAADGCWGYTEATLCIEVLNLIKDYPFWRRKKVWNNFHDRVVSQIVEPTNRKIQEVTGKDND